MKLEEAIVTEAIKGILSIAFDVIKKSGELLLKNFKDEEKILVSKLKGSINEYIHNMFNRYGYMKVLGMREGILLEEILVKVQLLPEVNANSYRSLEALEERFKVDGSRNLQYNDKSHDGIDVVNLHKQLIVLGPPGSGKSTFLKKIAFEALHYSKSAELNKYIPVIIELKKLEKGNSIVSYIVKEFSICNFPNTEEFIDYCLRQGRLLLILDGLDEINDNLEIEAINNIKDFIDKYGSCKYVISSRNLAYKVCIP